MYIPEELRGILASQEWVSIFLGRPILQVRVIGDFRHHTQQYKALQNGVAKKIPHEFDRPVINFEFQGAKRGTPAIKGIALIGGMGPISDGNILSALGEKLPSLEQPLRLLSLPPPRTAIELIRGGVTYVRRVWNLMNSGYQSYFLLSNSAHLNIQFLEMMPFGERVVDLRDKVAKDAKTKLISRALVLGTRRAMDGRLYHEHLSNLGIQVVQPTGLAQSKIDAAIESVKQGRWSARDRGSLALELIELASKAKSDGVILACTELPIALGAEGIKTVRKSGLKLVDSESVFVDAILRYLRL